MFSNFIYEKDDALSKELCDAIIKKGEKVLATNLISRSSGPSVGIGEAQFHNGKFGRYDYQLYLPDNFEDFWATIQSAIFYGLDEYKSEITAVTRQSLTADFAKWQKTPVNGGYSQWHIEQGNGPCANRSLAWMIYLNDIDNGGETEFLYQQMRVKPKAGTLLIWPAGVTHPHRGNPPYSGDKYILTGWFMLPHTHTHAQALGLLKGHQDAR